MTGKWVRGGARPEPQPGVILALRAYELHGTPYFAVQFRLDSDAEGGSREARVSADMIYPEPQAGDRVLVQSVVGVVDRMEKAQ